MIGWLVIGIAAVVAFGMVYVMMVSEQPTREERERALYDWSEDDGAFPETKPDANHSYFGIETVDYCLLWLGSPLNQCGRPRAEHKGYSR